MSMQRQNSDKFNFHIHSFGCKSNAYEADAVGLLLTKEGGTSLPGYQDADLIVFNTCTVTAEAGRKARQALRRARKEAPEAVLVAMGCHSQLEDMSDLADFCGGTSHRLDLVSQALDFLRGQAETQSEGSYGRDLNYEELGPVVQQTETRAKIKIADGCEEFCSYCAICLARGKIRSRDRQAIIEEAQSLLASGYKEIILTATHLTAFEHDKGRDSMALAELLLELNQLPGLVRLRLGSLEPQSLRPEFVEKISQADKLCPHFHLSLQSASDEVLEQMNRKYTQAEYRALVGALRQHFDRPAVTTDIMVGFPGETDQDFQETYNFAQEIGFARIHVFRYSIRKNTKAAQMPQVDKEVSRQRAEQLQELADTLAHDFARSHLGKQVEIILEQDLGDGQTFSGYTSRYLPGLVDFSLGQAQEGQEGELWLCEAVGLQAEGLTLRPIHQVI